jgi:hypothetical protein
MLDDNTRKYKVQAIPSISIAPDEIVRLTRLGKVDAEVMYMLKEHSPGIKKINKEEYMVIATGEIRRFKEHEGKQIENIRVIFRRLEHLITANFDPVENKNNALFVTLTYAENMQDENRLYTDFDAFYKRLKRAYKGHKLEYIAIAEPQERGAWHMHILLKSDQEILYIDNKKMADIWGHGFTETERLKSNDVGQYFSAYFTSLEVGEKDNEVGAVYTKDEKTGKRYKKGARLHFYPKHFKFYRCSRGIVRPEPENAVYNAVISEYGKPKKTKTYSVTKKVEPTEKVPEPMDKHVNTIQHERYKKRRK